MKLSFFVFLVMILHLNGQTSIEKSIDSLIERSTDQFVAVQFKEALLTTNNALKLSEEHHYSKGIATANIYIARLLLELGIYNRSLLYLKNAEEQPYIKKDFFLQAELYRIRGRIYENLKMGSLSLREFRKQLSVAIKIKSENRKNISKFWAHQNIAQVFERTRNQDSVLFHVTQMESLLPHFKEEEELFLFTSTYVKIAEMAFLEKDYTRCRFYLDKSMVLLDRYHSNFKFDILKIYGDLEAEQDHIEEAALYYEEAFNNALALDVKDQARYLSKIVADYYHDNQLDPLITNKYLYQYQRLNDSLETESKQATETLVSQILDQEAEESTKQQNFFLYLIAGIIAISCAIIGFLFLSYHRKKIRYIYKNKLLIKEQSKADELAQLTDVNTFNELIRMAKKNNPEFLILFKERYPTFVANLKALDPKVRSSELAFCAMAYLNFSTKDIAEYTFVTIRAVQIRKNRMRKKYSINSKEDFNSWMRKLGDETIHN